MARQADGRILVAGRSTAAGAVVARLRATGVLDPDFGGDGRVTLPGGGSASAVLVQPDRKIVVAGNASGSGAMTRHAPEARTARPTPTFGADGTATIDFGSLADLAAGAALPARRQDRRRRLHAGRRGRRGRAPERQRHRRTPRSASPARRPSTSARPTFGNAVALAPKKRIVVAGQKTGNDDFAVARLLG